MDGQCRYLRSPLLALTFVVGPKATRIKDFGQVRIDISGCIALPQVSMDKTGLNLYTKSFKRIEKTRNHCLVQQR